jgi:hypothetical protein
MAASNESQGLKIAVAVFIGLTVILFVVSYFLYSNGSVAEARLAKANEDKSVADRALSTQVGANGDLRTRIGVRTEDVDAVKGEIDAHYKKVYERLEKLGNDVRTVVQKVQQGGAPTQEVQDLEGKINSAIQSFRAENNRNYISSLDRLTEVMENLALLTTEMGVNFVDVRHNLESATNVTKTQVEVQTKAAEASHNDLMDEQKKHVEERQGLLTRVETMTKDNDTKTTEIANLKAQIGQIKDDYTKEKDTLTTIIRELRDKAERVETILDHPDGYITYVDHEARDQSSSSRGYGGASSAYSGATGEVQVNINRAMGARPQMKMSVFDAASPGVPTEKPKGTIELTKVGDTFSVARIVSTKDPIKPIRIGDIVYSPAWSPNTPTRFALVGKMDVNRDGRDDREELKRMIQEAGGVVDFDLPPPWVGKETGKLSPRIDWYVTDDRMPLREVFRPRSEPQLKDEAALNQRVGEVIKEARLDGVRPLPIERLLNYLGYDINTAVVGRAEAVNDAAYRRLTAKKPQVNTTPATKPATGAAPGEEKAAADDNAAADETPKKKAAADDDAAADETPKKKTSTPKKKAAQAPPPDDQ